MERHLPGAVRPAGHAAFGRRLQRQRRHRWRPHHLQSRGRRLHRLDRQPRLQRRRRRRNANRHGHFPNCADGNIVGYVAANPTARFIQAGVGTMPNTGSRHRQHAWPQHLEHVGLQDQPPDRAGIATIPLPDLQHLQPPQSRASVCRPTTATIDSNNNANPFNAGYIFVTSPTFLNKFSFDGGSRTMELGLRLVF